MAAFRFDTVRALSVRLGDAVHLNDPATGQWLPTSAAVVGIRKEPGRVLAFTLANGGTLRALAMNMVAVPRSAAAGVTKPTHPSTGGGAAPDWRGAHLAQLASKVESVRLATLAGRVARLTD